MRVGLIASFLVLVATPVLAGCLQSPAATLQAASLAPGVPGLLADAKAFPVDTPYKIVGRELKATAREGQMTDVSWLSCWTASGCPEYIPPCTDTNCEKREFNIETPPGFDGKIRFEIRWPTSWYQWFHVEIQDASGKTLATGHNGYLASVVEIEHPAPGKYVAIVIETYGKGNYEAALSLVPVAKATDARALLPNLVTLAPTDLRIETPSDTGGTPLGGGPLSGISDAGGSRGCALDERVEYLSTRCLRFSNAVGNIGDGPLEIRLSADQAAVAEAGMGHFVQRVFHADGSFTEVPVGTAQWHAMHNHWHNAAANKYTVYKYDVATSTRGAALGDGHKGGICFGDIGLIDVGLVGTTPPLPAHSGYQCFNPSEQKAWVMGLERNWYDLYYWTLSDQYVDISTATDGTYQLCSITNQDGLLKETNLADNEGCAVFKLTGDKIEVLSPEPYHQTRAA